MRGFEASDGEKLWGVSPNRASGTSLSDTDTPEQRGPIATQGSFNCSMLLASVPAHSAQASLCSVLENLPSFPESLQSAAFDSFEVNLCDSMKTNHRRQPSVIVNTEVEQSYTEILNGLESFPSSIVSSPSGPFFLVEKPKKNLYTQRMNFPEVINEAQGKPGETSADVISDFSSILENAGTAKPAAECSQEEVNPTRRLTEEVEEVAEERISTIYTNLSSDSSHLNPSLGNQTVILSAGKDPQTPNTLARTSKPSDSPHFEIDLFDTPSAEFRFERTVRASSDLGERQFGALPARAYCPACQSDVSTRVSFQLPKLPLWKSVCLVGEWLKCCSQRQSAQSLQEALHHCRHCKRLLARVSLA